MATENADHRAVTSTLSHVPASPLSSHLSPLPQRADVCVRKLMFSATKPPTTTRHTCTCLNSQVSGKSRELPETWLISIFADARNNIPDTQCHTLYGIFL